jgi:DNA invertase Pin-like site-specific DNA recombinase
MRMKKTKKDQVAELLKDNTDGLSILEIAKILKTSRNSVPVILAELKGEGKIRIRPIGRVKLHYWRGEKDE